MFQQNLVSTIIPVFNRPTFIIDAVESVLNQTHRPIEIIIVDDGSTDDTPEVLSKLSKSHQEIKLFRQENGGPGRARELGRINARGEYIQYLDSDDLLLNTKFELQVAALKDDPMADVCYGKTEVVDLGNAQQGIAHRRTAQQITCMFPLFLRERWWFTSTPLYRRSTTELAGPWSEESNEEDWEYDCRVASLGGRLVRVDHFVSLHRRHDKHLSDKGAEAPAKLRSRAASRAKIFQHAKKYMSLETRPVDIEAQDWRFFSDYAFLLARQCALRGLKTEARAMLSVSIQALESKTWQQILFIKLIKLMGWQKAALLIHKIRG